MINRCIYSLITLLALLYCSCNNEQSSGVSSDNINIQCRIARSETRLSEIGFQTGDSIGIYVTRRPEGGGPAVGIVNDDYAVNLKHVLTANGWQRPEGGQIPWPAQRNIDLYTYHPYDATITDPTNYLFTVEADQSIEENYFHNDLLWGSVLDASRAASVPVTFYHRMSRVNIRVQSSDVAGDLDAQTRIVVKEVVPSAYLNIETGGVSPAPGVQGIDVSPYVNRANLPGNRLTASAIVAPQSIAAGTSLIHIIHRGFTYEYITQSEVELLSGSAVAFDIRLTAQGVEVTVTSVADWGEGPIYDGSLGELTPLVADVSAIDWNLSYVHNIYRDGIQVGRVCREYLYRNNTSTDFPAIVTYPMGAAGSADLSRGYVAQLYNRARNSSNNQYEINPAAVHGGRVEFVTGNVLQSYTPGALAPVRKVVLRDDGSFGPTDDNAIVTLTTGPRFMRDADGTDYPLVKIGTQYWLKENLKSESYIDGTPLVVYYYNNDRATNRDILGGLYTWYTLATDPGVAPNGWRVPSRADWESLWGYLNPAAGTKMKAFDMWASAAYIDNVSGFSGLPGGRRLPGGGFNERNSYGQWWSSNEPSATYGWRIWLTSGGYNVSTGNLQKTYTQSVRLLSENQ